MLQLASKIASQLDALAHEYCERVSVGAVHSELTDGPQYVQARADLSLIAACLEKGEGANFAASARRQADNQLEEEGAVASLVHRLTALEEILLPLVVTTEEAVSLWRMMSAAKNAVVEVDAARRRQVDRALEQSQGTLQAIVDSMPFGLIVIDMDKTVRHANLAALSLMGYASEEEIVGQRCHDTLCPAGSDRCPILDLGLALDRSERVLVTQDGRRVPVLKSVVPVTLGGEDVLLEAFVDLTERKRAEREREQSRERIARQVRVGAEISQELASVPALGELFDRVVTLIKERLGYYHVQIFRHEPALNAVVLVRGYGDRGADMLVQGHSLPMHRGVVGTAAASGQSVLASDTLHEPGWVPNPHLPETRGELAVPIKLRDQVLGIIDVQSDTSGSLGEDDRLLLESISGPIGLAIESTALRQEMEDHLRELRAAQQAIGQEGWAAFRQKGALPEGYLFDRVSVEQARDLWEPEIELAVRLRSLVSPERVGLAGDQQNVVSVTPIVARDEVLGVLGVYPEPALPLSSQELDLMQMVSEQVAEALENARLVGATRDALAEARALYRFGELVGGETDVRAITAAVSQSLVAEFGFSACYVGVLDEEGDSLQGVARWAEGQEPTAHVVSISDPHDAAAMCVRQGKAVLLSGMQRDDLGDGLFDLGRREGVAAVPILAENKAIGALSVAGSSRQPEIGESHVRLLEAAALQSASAIRRAQLFEQTQQALSAADAATRRYLRDTWDTFLEGRAPASQVYIAGPEGAMLGEDLLLSELERDWEYGGNKPVAEWQRDSTGASRPALAVPLTARGQVIGVVDFYRKDASEQWTESEQELIEALVGQIGDSIEGERQFAQTQATLAETERMYQASQRISEADGQSEVVQVVLDTASSTTADRAAVFIFDRPTSGGLPEWQELAALWDRDDVLAPTSVGARYAVDEFPLVRLVSWEEPLVVSGLEQDEQIDDPIRDMLLATGVRAFVAVPISAGNEWLGYSLISWRAPHVFTAGEMRVYESVNDQAGTALRSARLYHEAQGRARREQLIREITSKMRSSPNLDTILNTAVQELGKALGVSRAFVRLSTGSGEDERRRGNVSGALGNEQIDS
jgi:PAS domain S-box-containing protein